MTSATRPASRSGLPGFAEMLNVSHLARILRGTFRGEIPVVRRLLAVGRLALECRQCEHS